MSKMSFSFSLNVILYMLKMSKIDQIHLRAVMKIDQIHLRAVMQCMSKMLKMGKEHTHTFLYRVCDMSKVSEMSFSFSLNVILSMLKMLKIDQILCILKHVEDVKDRSNTPKGCNAMYVEDVKDGK